MDDWFDCYKIFGLFCINIKLTYLVLLLPVFCYLIFIVKTMIDLIDAELTFDQLNTTFEVFVYEYTLKKTFKFQTFKIYILFRC
jgi:hypothetical protein